MPATNKSKMAFVVRWIARIGSIASGGMLVAFIFGGHEQAERAITPSEAVGFAFFPIGILIGMALAWRYELVGGLVTVGSLIGFYLWHLVTSGDLPTGPYFFIFALPGFLFLLAWMAQRIQGSGWARAA